MGYGPYGHYSGNTQVQLWGQCWKLLVASLEDYDAEPEAGYPGCTWLLVGRGPTRWEWLKNKNNALGPLWKNSHFNPEAGKA